MSRLEVKYSLPTLVTMRDNFRAQIEGGEGTPTARRVAETHLAKIEAAITRAEARLQSEGKK